MAMRQATHDWTVERLHRLPDDGQRYEIIDGELFVTPSPVFRHQYAVLELSAVLLPYCRTVGLRVGQAPSDIPFSARTLVQPDVLVLPLNAAGRPPAEFAEVGRLMLAVEVLSPSTAHVDRDRKRRLYQTMQVPEYWIVDTAARTVERWLPESRQGEVFRDTLLWQPVVNHAALEIDLVTLFRHVYGE